MRGNKMIRPIGKNRAFKNQQYILNCFTIKVTELSDNIKY